MLFSLQRDIVVMRHANGVVKGNVLIPIISLQFVVFFIDVVNSEEK